MPGIFMVLSLFCGVLFFALLVNASPVDADRVQLGPRWPRLWQNETGSALFKEQMENPSEVFSVLLIIGGDIVQKAVAQMTGRRLTLVVFSFGWVAYSFNSLMSAFGDGSLMPDPDISCEVFTISSGIKKTNSSWTIGRLLRDLEREVSKGFVNWFEEVSDYDGPPSDIVETNDPNRRCRQVGQGTASLLITFCTAQKDAAKPQMDNFFGLYLFIAFLQLVIASIPTILWGNWSILFMTVVGTILAVISASLREWRLEKYQARRHSKQTYAITRGNGHRHIFIIQPGDPEPISRKYPGLNLIDLAGSVRKADDLTRTKTVILSIIWIWFLITVGGLKENTWFLMIIGIIGMAQNVWVAGRHQPSQAHGIPLQINDTYGKSLQGAKPIPGLEVRRKFLMKQKISNSIYTSSKQRKAMLILQDVEFEHPTVGRALVTEFFPKDSWSAKEITWWRSAEDYSDYRKAKEKYDQEKEKYDSMVQDPNIPPPLPPSPPANVVAPPPPPEGYIRLKPAPTLVT